MQFFNKSQVLKHNITSKLLTILEIITLSMVSTSLTVAQNTITVTFKNHKVYNDDSRANAAYKAGDKVDIDLTFAEGKVVTVEEAVEKTAENGL